MMAIIVAISGIVYAQTTKHQITEYMECGWHTSVLYHDQEVNKLNYGHGIGSTTPCIEQGIERGTQTVKDAVPIYGHRNTENQFKIAVGVLLLIAVLVYAVPATENKSHSKK